MPVDRDPYIVVVRVVVAFALLSAALAPGPGLAAEPPMVTAGRLAADVTVDGRVAVGEWDGAAPIAGFVKPGDGLARASSSCSVGWDSQGLVALWRCEGRPVYEQRGHDGELWRDDAVEVMLQPPGEAQYYHFLAGPGGDTAEELGRDRSWDAAWNAGTSVGDGSWLLEMRIPFASMGRVALAVGETWRANFNRDARLPAVEVSSWAPVQTGFHEPDRFGYLAFGGGPAQVGLTSLTLSGPHTVNLDCLVAAGASLRASLHDGDQEIAALTADASGLLSLDIPRPGDFVLRLTGSDAGGNVLMRQEMAVVRKPPIVISLAPALLINHRVTVALDSSGLDQPAEDLAGLGPVRYQRRALDSILGGRLTGLVRRPGSADFGAREGRWGAGGHHELVRGGAHRDGARGPRGRGNRAGQDGGARNPDPRRGAGARWRLDRYPSATEHDHGHDPGPMTSLRR
ncbi:MAG TPA: carbohydrate-binding family 9-like protein [Armatimonadota bacterium]|nr:carbohydrate-binding family 9-like protein [Armatimonadota bacterium]